MPLVPVLNNPWARMSRRERQKRQEGGQIHNRGQFEIGVRRCIPRSGAVTGPCWQNRSKWSHVLSPRRSIGLPTIMSSAPSKTSSEDIIGQKYDRCVADLIVKS
ncbi:hypothetical protein AG1IA_03095 [Rhizoctonia solani AG-1 IA]|uniref:Uncharacterized protein n=1 Tax=Thanatephorus cucumeris (strain AG1-IA) TaxID=983506 RepID=L8X1J0_THACA|nr:hypothetical protein AG1IA_03095 [Rhizoctonia solani AG-1 IA]